MTPLRSYPVLLLLLSALAMLSGCARKKPVTVKVPQEQPPIVAPTPAPTPQAAPQESQPAAQPSQQENQQSAGTSSGKTQSKPHHRKHAVIKKPSPAVRAADTPPPQPRPEPGSTPAPIAPTVSPRDAQRDQSSTERLLQAAENTLNNIKRQLSKEEVAMMAQARNYITQSRQATKDNDPARAFTLAQKANWLSNELLR